MGKDQNGKELGEGISQRSNGTYTARYVDRFGKRKTIYNKDKKKIKELLNIALYEDKMHLNVMDNKFTLNEWYVKWMNIHKYKTIRPNTKVHYEQVYTHHIKPDLGNIALNNITQLRIKELLIKLDKKGLSYETKNKVRIILLDMFNKAMIDHYARENPAKGIRVIRDEEKEVRVLTPEEQADFFDCCKGTFYDNLFTVAVLTGLRPGELFALRWEDINFERKEISVTRTLFYQKVDGDDKKMFHFNPPKTKSSIRKVPINRQCEIALKKQKLQYEVIMNKVKSRPIEGCEDLLFTCRLGTPMNSSNYSAAIKTIIDQINLYRDELEQMEYFSGHCFRHTFATRCFEADIQPKTVQTYLGHASLKMTMDLYTHVLDEKKQEEMKKLELSMDELFKSGDLLAEERFERSQEKENRLKNNVVDMNGVRVV